MSVGSESCCKVETRMRRTYFNEKYQPWYDPLQSLYEPDSKELTECVAELGMMRSVSVDERLLKILMEEDDGRS